MGAGVGSELRVSNFFLIPKISNLFKTLQISKFWGVTIFLLMSPGAFKGDLLGANFRVVMQETNYFLWMDVDTIYGYYQSRFSSLGPSYKGEIFYFRPNFDKLPNPVECKLNFLR